MEEEEEGPPESDEDSELEGPSLLYDTYAHDARRTEAAAKRMRAAADLLAAAQGRVVRDRDALQAMHERVARSFPDWIQTPSRNAVGIFELELETLANAYVAHTRRRPDALATDADATQFVDQAGASMHNREFARSLADRERAAALFSTIMERVHALCRPEAAVSQEALCRALMVGVRLVQWCECVASLVREGPPVADTTDAPLPPVALVDRMFRNPPRTLQQCALALFACALLPPYAIGLQMRNGARRATPWADTNTALDERTREQYNWCRTRYDMRGRRWLTDEEVGQRAFNNADDPDADPLRHIHAVPVDTIVKSQHAVPIELVVQMRHEERRRKLELERMEPATEEQKRLYEDCLVLSAWAHALDGALAAEGHTGCTEDRMPYCLLQCAAFSWMFGSNQTRVVLEGAPYCRPTAGTEYDGPAHGVRRLPVIAFVTPFFYATRCGVCGRTTWHGRAVHAVAAWLECTRRCHRDKDGYGCKIKL